MDIRHLQYFLKAIECGSVTAAAQQLGVAQPTLTKSLRQLERQLGVALFKRLPRGIEPTEAGRRFARHGFAVEVQMRDALRELRSIGSAPQGELTVGAGPAWLRRLLPDAATRVAAAHPDLKLRIVGGFDDSLLRDLRGGNLDLVVAELPVADDNPDLILMPLVADAFAVVARAGHPLAGRPCSLRDLSRQLWVMPPANTRAQQRLAALFVAAGHPVPHVRIETGSMAFLIGAVRRSDFLTYTVSTTLAAAEGEGLIMLDAPGVSVRREAGILMRRDGWLSPAMQALIDELCALSAVDPRN
jgi:DNA-binding transcriptional LysR family regulator